MSQTAEVFRFLVSGAFLVVVDVGLYSLLIHFLPHAVSKAISFTCGGVLAYLINKHWTFKQQRQSTAEVIRFVVANSSALVLNVATNAFFLKRNEEAVFFAVAAATAVTTVFTFVTFKFWVFTSGSKVK